MTVSRVEKQRRELERRHYEERRKRSADYIRGEVERRSGVDRRSAEQRSTDNAFVGSWIERLDNLRS